MNVIDIRSLLDGTPKKITPYPNIQDAFRQYKNMRKKVDGELTDFEAFYAGYMLANPVVRERLPKTREVEFDARYSN